MTSTSLTVALQYDIRCGTLIPVYREDPSRILITSL
jgi:hypothetical protein